MKHCMILWTDIHINNPIMYLRTCKGGALFRNIEFNTPIQCIL